MSIFILFVCVLYFLVHSVIVVIKGNPEMKREKERIGKGGYVKLEWELFCEERDKYLEEHADEGLLYPDLNLSSYVPWARECLIRAQERLKGMGYLPVIWRSYGVWVEKQKGDTQYIKTLRSIYESEVNYKASKWVKLEWDRDPKMWHEYPAKSLPQIYELPEYKKYMPEPYKSKYRKNVS